MIQIWSISKLVWPYSKYNLHIVTSMDLPPLMVEVQAIKIYDNLLIQSRKLLKSYYEDHLSLIQIAIISIQVSFCLLGLSHLHDILKRLLTSEAQRTPSTVKIDLVHVWRYSSCTCNIFKIQKHTITSVFITSRYHNISHSNP